MTNYKDQSGIYLQDFLKKKSFELQYVERQRARVQKETNLKKKRQGEKKTFLDSITNRSTSLIITGEKQNFTENVSNGGANLKGTVVRKNGGSERDIMLDFLEKKSSSQRVFFQQSTHVEQVHKGGRSVADQQAGKSVGYAKLEQVEEWENQDKWIKGLIKKAIEGQKNWTKGVINDIKKDLIKREKNQRKFITEMVIDILQEHDTRKEKNKGRKKGKSIK
ncbi:MAG: hypothetical protein GY941_00395 [Planctomycetes bacterium]|nr:hypothetical protein [Planctomycetota bacterium]